jgi:hypothetical protein
MLVPSGRKHLLGCHSCLQDACPAIWQSARGQAKAMPGQQCLAYRRYSIVQTVMTALPGSTAPNDLDASLSNLVSNLEVNAANHICRRRRATYHKFSWYHEVEVVLKRGHWQQEPIFPGGDNRKYLDLECSRTFAWTWSLHSVCPAAVSLHMNI